MIEEQHFEEERSDRRWLRSLRLLWKGRWRYREYLGAVALGYVFTALNIVAQILLVPLYLQSLGRLQFGILMILLAVINYAAIGVGWMSSGVLRVFGECLAANDQNGFARAYTLAKLFYTLYALILGVCAVAIVICCDSYLGTTFEAHQHEITLAVITAAAYLVILYEFSVERLTLVAAHRQALANLLSIISLTLYVVCVIPWLRYGGGLDGVFACLIGGVVVARAIVWVASRASGATVRWVWPDRNMIPLLGRLIGPMGVGYLLFGLIVLTLQADVLIVSSVGGVAMAAEFTLLWKVAEVLTQVIFRLPEHLQTYLIRMDARGDRARLAQVTRSGFYWLAGMSALTGLAYALLGSTLVKWWVGADNAPQSPLGFALAGGAIFWLGTARLPMIVALAVVRLKSLLIVSGVELIAKLSLTLLLLPQTGYLAPLIALNVVHLAGAALAYRHLLLSAGKELPDRAAATCAGP